jgi:hypothetical protein
MERLAFRGKPKVADLTSARRLADKARGAAPPGGLGSLACPRPGLAAATCRPEHPALRARGPSHAGLWGSIPAAAAGAEAKAHEAMLRTWAAS